MKVVALVSGGKDSCYAMMKCQEYGHEIVALANLMPVDEAQDELDSYMYQTVGHQIVVSYAQCMGIPLFRRRIQGSTRHHSLSYNVTPGDEVEDMFILLKEVKRQIPSVAAVSSGAIASDYQRLRVESVCSRLGLVSLAYLWKQDQSLLLQQMIRSGIVAIIVKVAAIGLDPSKHLGKEITHVEVHLHKLKELYGINVCGEGGEYETLTLDCPLFKNARIVLDKFQVVLHSSDQIAPVGVLHPMEYHLENKLVSLSACDNDKSYEVTLGEFDSVCEVLGDCQDTCEAPNQKNDVISDLALDTQHDIHISESRKDSTISIACWLQDASKTSADLREDLKVVLTRIELLLMEYNCSWENVLYIHLYIADMNEFAPANEEYVKFITQEKCWFGVPSRSTIELPLLQAGLGRAYIEVLVSNDNTKNVLHVQSISEWAPSCIGPYSQATVHKDVLYMAGQLGLDPPTMLLCDQGPPHEFQQALTNSEAVAKCFNCSISTSAVSLVIFCSVSVNSSDRIAIEDQKDVCLAQMKLRLNSGRRPSMPVVNDPVILYVLVPDLPKRASVEVKPLLYCGENIETSPGVTQKDLSMGEVYWGFQHESWHNNCLQKCIISGRLCTAVISVTQEIAGKICPQTTDSAYAESQCKVNTEKQAVRMAEFCIYLLDKVLLENDFSWDDVMNLRIYFIASPHASHETLSTIFTNAFNEFGEMSRRIDSDKGSFFNLVPVLGAGRSATSLDNILTCELFARKS
ncbi:diphthine--ammonia ligase isoform X1 [Sesamum indicum]|uniref:Diphthine--ammonia ligase n=2 Tax=Sesamum indicum TaxID=4182 RepID=A0A6I9TAL4_SESIN|nr:diphthine--ammonia ligase isoform X1 [Sesamum indicum]XP_011080571.1 diphthine--ammonia ligase isoform X1 [Sesamum indicum]XP_011080572.1 diphthine--ammonia ligase isoform X1 [Sesamum indicum]XP_020550429.1 diphthine--ammonia ligase isoform X1 [Sesamum indicum]